MANYGIGCVDAYAIQVSASDFWTGSTSMEKRVAWYKSNNQGQNPSKVALVSGGSDYVTFAKYLDMYVRFVNWYNSHNNTYPNYVTVTIGGIVPSSNWSVVPHVVEYYQDNDVNCAPTSWSMGLASEFGIYISQDKLASLMHTGPDGTDPSDAIAEMQALGYNAYTKPWSQEGLAQLAKDVADPNTIVVLLVMTGPLRYDSNGNLVWQGDYGHYEYPVGVNVAEGLIQIADPVKGLKTWTAAAVEAAMAEHSGNSVFITAKK